MPTAFDGWILISVFLFFFFLPTGVGVAGTAVKVTVGVGRIKPLLWLLQQPFRLFLEDFQKEVSVSPHFVLCIFLESRRKRVVELRIGATNRGSGSVAICWPVRDVRDNDVRVLDTLATMLAGYC